MGHSATPLSVATAPESTFDPSLTALFASSSGPIKAPATAVKTSASRVPSPSPSHSSSDEDNDHELDPDDTPAVSRPAKRRRVAEPDLEASYFQRLAKEEEREQRQKEPKPETELSKEEDAESDSDGDINENDSNDDDNMDDDQENKEDAVPLHESLAKGAVNGDYDDQARRTVFLSNVSTAAIKSKASKKILLDHLQSAIPSTELPATKLIQSFRFRSTPYVADGGPKRATYAKKELMEQTTHSTNAYAVFASEQAANLVVEKLNGTVVLDRHLRLDKVTSPAAIDHKRCVFIGNLPFMDEEQSENKTPHDPDGPPRRPRAKQPADAEEGLWRVFSKVGKVENVRVVRDKETRVSKGFAYVQFADANAVEEALLFDGKKFPPLLPRILRVSRAKRPRPTASSALSSSRKSKPVQQHSRLPGSKQPSTRLVFEGHRASAANSQSHNHSKPKAKKRSGPKPSSRSARRGASFKASGGIKNRDKKETRQ